MQELDQLISTLAAAAGTETNSAQAAHLSDAIDRELASPRRMSNIISLADSPEMNAFRSELIDGLIRVDTANQFLRVLNQVITQLLL